MASPPASLVFTALLVATTLVGLIIGGSAMKIARGS
jgi:hypothetical protein